MFRKLSLAILSAFALVASVPAFAAPDVAPVKQAFKIGTAYAGSGSALTSTVFDTRRYSEVNIYATAASADRVLKVNCVAEDKTTTLFTAADITVAFAAPSNAVVTLNANNQATAATRQTILGLWCPFIKMTAASVAGTLTLTVWGR